MLGMIESASSNELQAWVAQEVRAEASRQKMNIAQLAAKAGIADKVLRRALDCERPFHLPQLIRVSDALGLTLTALIGEAERRQGMASPRERAAAMIQSDLTLSKSQKSTLLSGVNRQSDDVASSPDVPLGGGNHHA